MWHSDTTRLAVAQGQARECVCQGCHHALFSVRGAAYVLCPLCSTVCLLPPEHLVGGDDADNTNESAAICVGVKRDDAPSSRS